MKFLTDRHDIARALNFNRYPVIQMDISHPKAGWDSGVYEGPVVRIDAGLEYFLETQAMIFTDPHNKGIVDDPGTRVTADIYLESYGACLKSSFGASDVFKMASNANAPIVKAGQPVIVVYKLNTGDDTIALVRKMKVSDRIARFTSTPAKLIDID